ncbi:unnamed protein product, partial [Musa acuminata subsp. burmannicoides]
MGDNRPATISRADHETWVNGASRNSLCYNFPAGAYGPAVVSRPATLCQPP